MDLRSAAAFRRRHLRGAVSIPRPRLPRSLFLLPPPARPLLLVWRHAAAAQEAARFLAARGRPRTAWLDGSTGDLPPRLSCGGRSPNRVWEPAPLLRRFLPRLPRDGAAIDLACGSGREAAFLALHRGAVLGVDVLPDALRQARALARAAGVAPGRLTLRRFDLADEAAAGALLRPRGYRIVLCFRYLQRSLWPAMTAALAPGGWLVCQTFLEAQARCGRRPSRAAYLLKPGELRAAFAAQEGIEIVHYHEGADGRGDQLASLVARNRGQRHARTEPQGGPAPSANTVQSRSGKRLWRDSRSANHTPSMAPFITCS